MWGCGCCWPNLHAAGGSAAPSSPSPLQVTLLILLPLCADFAGCVYTMHPFCAMCVIICLFVAGVSQACVCLSVYVCVWGCISQLSTASWGHRSHVCVSVSPTVWNHSRLHRLQQYWALGSASSAGKAQNKNKSGRSCPWPLVHIQTVLF